MTSASNRPRRSVALVAVVGGLVLLALSWFTARADAERLLGRTTEVQATVTQIATVDAKTTGFPRWIRQRYTVTWTDSTGAPHTGTSTVISGDGAGHDLGQTIAAQWVSGTDDVTVATTGQSMVAVFNRLMQRGAPKEIHIAVVIAAPEGIAYLKKHLPDNCHLWVAALDEKLNEKNYIVPGLGDAGDLAYGNKL